MELQRSVTVAVGGVTKRFGPESDLSGVSPDVIGRMRRAGAFGDSAEALGVEGDGGAKAGEPINLEAMTVAQLRELAETKGLDLGEARNKGEIVAVLTAAEKN